MSHRRRANKRGFTLAEIIIVIIIMGAIASFALPRMSGVFERMRATEGVQVLAALRKAQRAYRQETGGYTTDLADLDVEFDNLSYFTSPDPNTPADPVASVRRAGSPAGNHYDLEINDDGTICCEEIIGGLTCGEAGNFPAC